MKCEAKTEQEMRDVDVKWPKTIEDLTEYIESLTNREHDYGTSVYAMSLAATAAFHYAASKVGATGFQASCADLDVLRRTRSIKGPFMIIDADNMLYPQYDLHGKLQEAMDSWAEWAAEEAQKKLDGDKEHVHPDVLAHWRRLVERNQSTAG